MSKHYLRSQLRMLLRPPRFRTTFIRPKSKPHDIVKLVLTLLLVGNPFPEGMPINSFFDQQIIPLASED